MVDINSTLPLLEPLSTTFKDLLKVLEILVGGLFGIYVISLIVRLIFFRKIYKSFEEIKVSMKKMEAKIDRLSKKK